MIVTIWKGLTNKETLLLSSNFKDSPSISNISQRFADLKGKEQFKVTVPRPPCDSYNLTIISFVSSAFLIVSITTDFLDTLKYVSFSLFVFIFLI